VRGEKRVIKKWLPSDLQKIRKRVIFPMKNAYSTDCFSIDDIRSSTIHGALLNFFDSVKNETHL